MSAPQQLAPAPRAAASRPPAPHHPGPRHGPFYRAVLRYSRALHTYLSMLAIVLFMFFGATGFMLNHPVWFGLDNTRTSESTLTIPPEVIAAKDKLMLVEFLRARGATGAVQQFDWPGEGEPFHVTFKSPAAQYDADLTLPGGETHVTIETRGLSGRLTRLHTAKDAGRVWQFVLDATAVLLILICVTGLILWQSLPRRRTIGAVAFVVSVLAIGVAYWLCVP